MSWQPQNGRDALSKADMLTKGVDATRHPLVGNVLSHSCGSPEQQARNYLWSEFNAGRMSDTEYSHWSARLTKFHAANSVVMPPRAVSIDHPERRTK